MSSRDRPKSSWLDRVALAGSIGLLVAVLATVADVGGRASGLYHPRGVIDLIGIMVVLSVSLALAACEWNDDHIRVEPLTGWLSARARRALDRFWHTVAAGILGLAAVRGLAESWTAHQYGEVTPGLGASKLVYGVPLAAGFGLAAFVAVLAAMRRTRTTSR
jgi:TRAP-type C4-dicarboxylate transport system permease small subunit